MPHVSDSALHEMLAQLPDEQARSLANIVSGKITHQVRCLSETCQGEVVGYLYVDGTDSRGRIKYRVEPVVKPDGSIKLYAHRKRLDSQYGFECSCGQDSRIARHEAGALKYDGKPPTREGLEDIYAQLQKNPADYPEINGIREVDGFQIERVT
jgi:hypothetical protein